MIQIKGNIDGKSIDLTINGTLTEAEGKATAQYVRAFYRELATTTAKDIPAIAYWYVTVTNSVLGEIDKSKKEIKAMVKNITGQIEKLVKYFNR